MEGQILSQNAIAAHTGRDRRTVAKALRGIEPDGNLPSGPGWLLGTAESALGFMRPERHASSSRSGVAEIALDRLDGWREIHARDRIVLTIDELSECLGIHRGAVVVWLRAGCPYAGEPGDFETGDAFRFVPSWTIDWVAMMTAVVDSEAARRLRLAG